MAPGVTRSGLQHTQAVFEDSYVEEVDRAMEQSATTPSGMRSFGEMVARRGMRKISEFRFQIAE